MGRVRAWASVLPLHLTSEVQQENRGRDNKVGQRRMQDGQSSRKGPSDLSIGIVAGRRLSTSGQRATEARHLGLSPVPWCHDASPHSGIPSRCVSCWLLSGRTLGWVRGFEAAMPRAGIELGKKVCPIGLRAEDWGEEMHWIELRCCPVDGVENDFTPCSPRNTADFAASCQRGR